MRELGRLGGEATARKGEMNMHDLGRKGGQATLARHGKEHFSAAGKKGWLAMQKAKRERGW